MIFGLCGVHRCGKTYLAQILAERFNMTFQPSVIRMSFEHHGLYPDQILTWEQRIAVQNTALDNIEKAIQKHRDANTRVIFDRTPIDLVGYTMTTVVEEGGYDHDTFVRYMQRACSLMKNYKRALVVQPHPDLDFKEEPYKGRNEAQHMRLLENSMSSMAIMQGIPVLPYRISLEDRPVVAAEMLGLS